MKYPTVLSEDETLDLALKGYSLARYGDGELRIITGGNCISQMGGKRIARDLAAILNEPESSNLIPCIPNVRTTVKDQWRTTFGGPPFTPLYGRSTYGSAFITRPDSAPWIDRADYWAKVSRLWVDQDITLVLGTERSLHAGNVVGARSVKEVWGPRRDAYTILDALEEEVGQPSGPILLCLGPAATVLAARLAHKGLWAVDVGHIGMFMKHAGAYKFKRSDLMSADYMKQNQELHAREKFGHSGHKQAKAVMDFACKMEPEVILDYGCGEGTLAKELVKLGFKTRVMEYDPGVPGKENMPKPAQLLVCTDVLEHVEPDKLDNVLAHIYSLSSKAYYFLIATRPAQRTLPDGRNAHLIIKDANWWWKRLQSAGFVIQNADIAPKHAVKFWCVR